MTFWDALTIMGLEPSSTQAELKAQADQLALRLHPDHGGDVETFREMRFAYEVCKTKLPERRACVECDGTGKTEHTSGFYTTTLRCRSCGGRGTQ